MLANKQVKKVGNDLLFNAITHGDVHELTALIREDEADVNARNINGQTPLHYAVQFGNRLYVDILLKNGANPDIQEHHEIGHNTPLHKAVEQNNIDLVESLMNNNADPSIRNKAGFTGLHIAAKEGYVEIAKFLLSQGLDPNIRDAYGYSASYWAKENKHTALCEILPAPLKISKEEYYEHICTQWEREGFNPGGKKKKGKGKKKK